MKAKATALLLADLGAAKSHSKPYTSNDCFNSFKYRPQFPKRFGCIEDASAYCREFFPWYNDSHRHSGIGYMTPAAVHHGQAQALFQLRAKTLDAAFMANPKRFKGNCPEPPKLPVAAWINPPKMENAINKTTYPSTLN